MAEVEEGHFVVWGRRLDDMGNYEDRRAFVRLRKHIATAAARLRAEGFEVEPTAKSADEYPLCPACGHLTKGVWTMRGRWAVFVCRDCHTEIPWLEQ